MSTVRRLERARTAAIIGEMGTGKTFMAMSAVHCEAAGRRYACLVMPGYAVRKVVQRIVGDNSWRQGLYRRQPPFSPPRHHGAQGVNEVRLRRGESSEMVFTPHSPICDCAAITNHRGIVGSQSMARQRTSSSSVVTKGSSDASGA